MTTPALHGILPVLPTPFSESGGVDARAMERVVEFALRAGVAGLVFPGFASEVETLDPDERAELLSVVVAAVGGRVPVVAGASAETPDLVILHGRSAMNLGVRILMVQPPRGLAAGAVTGFMGAVADGLPGAELILQNAPAPRGSDLSPETIVGVISDVPAITYVKEETLPAGPAIERILAAHPGNLKGAIGGGGGRFILDEYARGARAAMPALEIADIHVALDAAWRCGDRARARALYVRSLPLLVLQAVYRMRLTKYVLTRRGVVENAIVRAPTSALDAAAAADIDENLRELGVLPAGADREGAAA